MQQHEYHQPQHIETISHKTKNNNYNSIELHPRPAYSKKHQQQPNINYHNSISQPNIDSSSVSSAAVAASTHGHHHHMQHQQGVYYYKVENYTSFGTISCMAENSYGSSKACLVTIVEAGWCEKLFSANYVYWYFDFVMCHKCMRKFKYLKEWKQKSFF